MCSAVAHAARSSAWSEFETLGEKGVGGAIYLQDKEGGRENAALEDSLGELDLLAQVSVKLHSGCSAVVQEAVDPPVHMAWNSSIQKFHPKSFLPHPVNRQLGCSENCVVEFHID